LSNANSVRTLLIKKQGKPFDKLVEILNWLIFFLQPSNRWYSRESKKINATRRLADKRFIRVLGERA